MTDLYERQREIEYEAVMLGRDRYEKTRIANGDGGTKPGLEQTRLLVPLLAEAIREFTDKAAKRAGERYGVLPYMLFVEPEQAAYLTVRYTLDAAAVGKSLSTIAREVGEAIQDHINILKLSDEAPGLFRKVMEQLKVSTAARHRTGVLRKVITKYTADSLKWSTKDKVKLGINLVKLLESSCNVIEIVEERTNSTHSRVRVRLTEKAAEWFKNRHLFYAEFAPVHLPMIVPPRAWGSPFCGGYLTAAIRGVRMIQSHSPGFLDEVKNVHMPEVYDAINIVQATPWRINRAVLDVMKGARELTGERYQSLFVESDSPIPARPTSVPEDVPFQALALEQKETLTEWKRDAAEAYAGNARLAGKRAAVGKKLWVAERYADEATIWFPHYLDFRGRMYPFASYLNPQDEDAGRALLEFAEGKPLGERGLFWLKVHIANLFGVDKVSFADRVAWTNENLEKLLACVASPLDDLHWSEADSPWMALAACFELAGALIEGEAYVSHLPISMDGSCSGLQHYSAMLRDPIGGATVNLVPAEKPGDIYSAVAQRAQAIVDGSHDAMSAAWKGGKVVRKIAKQPTMTVCYSSTLFGMREQIKRAVISLGGEKYVNGTTPRAAAEFLAPIIRDAIGESVVSARDAMMFLKALAKAAASADLPIRWTSPLGFPVVQEYREARSGVVEVYCGGQRFRLTLTRDGTRLDKRRQALGVAPNFVHSLDASHLMSTVVLGYDNDLRDWAVVHDSFGVHAADVDTLHACVRESFIEQYTPNVLARLRDEVAGQLGDRELDEPLPEVPALGTLDLAAVRESKYFFA